MVLSEGASWPSGRVREFLKGGPGFEMYLCCVVTLSKTHKFPLILITVVIPCPGRSGDTDMTENFLLGC